MTIFLNLRTMLMLVGPIYFTKRDPVVADFWPSHFEILSDEECGFLAYSTNSWFYSLEALSKSHFLRKKFLLML